MIRERNARGGGFFFFSSNQQYHPNSGFVMVRFISSRAYSSLAGGRENPFWWSLNRNFVWCGRGKSQNENKKQGVRIGRSMMVSSTATD